LRDKLEEQECASPAQSKHHLAKLTYVQS
jgi:hypothetical protein